MDWNHEIIPALLAIGCGAGLYYLAIITTVLAIGVLIGLGHIDRYFERHEEKYNKSH